MAALQFQAEHFLVAIRTEHQAFYRRTFRHRAVCPPRSYALLNCPISLMTVNCEHVAEQVYGRYPFFRSSAFERRMLFGGLAGTREDGTKPAVSMFEHQQPLVQGASAL